MGCGKICGSIMGLLVLVAGASMLGVFGAQMASTISGVCFVLFGLGKLVHKMGMCPMCKDADCCKK